MKVTKVDIRHGERGTTKVYIFVVGESLLCNLMNRHSRPEQLYRAEVMPKVLAEMGLPPETQYRWSQRAGCKCGCSPGFVIGNSFGRAVYVDVEGDDAKTEVAA